MVMVMMKVMHQNDDDRVRISIRGNWKNWNEHLMPVVSIILVASGVYFKFDFVFNICLNNLSSISIIFT